MGSRADDSALLRAEEIGRVAEVTNMASVSGTKTLLVGMEKLDNTHWLHQCHVHGNAERVILGLKAWHQDKLGVRGYVLMHLLFRQSFIAIGTASPFSTYREAQTFHETHFDTLERHEVLTRGFSRPSSLAGKADLFNQLSFFAARPATAQLTSEYRRILVITHELNRMRIFYTFVAAAMLTVGISVGLGVMKHNVGLDATIGAAILNSLAVVQVAFIWMYK